MVITEAKTPLKVIVVGAGTFHGFAPRLARAYRHDTRVSPKSTGWPVTQDQRKIIIDLSMQLMEVGAGIQGSPNMLRLFDRWGVSPLIHSKDVALEYIHIRRWQDGSLLGTMPVNKKHGQPMVIHRADLHNALIERALTLKNVELHVDSHVTDVDFSSASVALTNGTVVQGDIVIAADGIKSRIRDHLLGKDASKPIATGDAAYRIILPRSIMEQDPELKKLISEPEATRWLGPDRHLMAYPIRNHELYNVVLLHPDRHGIEESWTTKGSKKRMIDDYKGWDPIVTKLINLVPDDEVLEWKLCSHAPLKTWIRGSVALIGDACHPMLPYVAQGAAQAVEDAAALGVLLSEITSKREIPLALQAYEKSRKQRAETVQQSGTTNRTTLHLPDGPEQQARDEQFRASTKEGSNPDKWSDRETQEFLWGWDAEKVALKMLNELRGKSFSDVRHRL